MDISNMIALLTLPLDKLDEVGATPEECAAASELMNSEIGVLRERAAAVRARMDQLEAEHPELRPPEEQ